MWMAGYAARNKPSEGKIHDLYAKAIALWDSAGNRLVIINAEVVGIRREDRDWLEQELGKRFGLKPEEFLVNVTHTHSGPEFRIDQSSRNVMPAEQFGDSIANAVEAALLAQQEPVEGPLQVKLEEIKLHFDNIPDLHKLNEMKESEDRYDARRAMALLNIMESTG